MGAATREPTDLPNLATKTASTDLARRTLAGGHYQQGSDAYVYCPVCPDRHTITLYASMGRLPHGEMVRQLAASIRDVAIHGDH